jgi:hypothetical protein
LQNRDRPHSGLWIVIHRLPCNEQWIRTPHLSASIGIRLLNYCNCGVLEFFPLMPEMAHPCKDHRHLPFVRGGYNLFVAHRTAGLDGRRCAGVRCGD